jgi:spore germination protein YaaH
MYRRKGDMLIMVKGKLFIKAVALGIAFIVALFPYIANTASVGTEKFNMSYIYFGDSSSYVYHVDNTKNSLNEISPSYFDLNEDGSLLLTQAIDIDFIEEMHNRGIKVVPFISNHWDRNKGAAALDRRGELAEEIADAVKKYDLDGVNIDIENMTKEHRDKYSDFVRLLRKKLPTSKTIAVSVAPNPYWTDNGWQGAYDYSKLAKYSDYLMIMCYDESYESGPAGPVASASFVEKSIIYALEHVPKEKIVLGLPFYGRFWKDGEQYGGYGISNKTVEKLIEKYKGKVIFDEKRKSAKAIIQIRPYDEKPVVMGRKLEAGTYTLWFENEQSLKYKLTLVNKYDLKGTGSWSLGQEALSTWNYYSMWLNGYYIEDVPGHWAQQHIISMVDKEWMKGISASIFAPNNPLTRAEAATILVRALGLEEKKGVKAGFTDTFGHWAEDEINIAAQHGVVLGTGDGSFSPDRPVSRQELAVMLDRVLINLDTKQKTVNPYKDLDASRYPWSYHSIIKLTGYGVFTGNPDGAFYPLSTATRAEMAAIMDRVSLLIK